MTQTTSSSNTSKASRSFPYDTFGQRFIEETYSKDRDTRIKWFLRNKDLQLDQDVGRDGAGGGSKQYDVYRKRIEAGCPRPTESLLALKDRYQPADHRKRIRTFDDHYQASPSMDDESLVDMLPPDDATRRQLYNGTTKEGKGRYQYLRSRNVPGPDSKYRLPVLTSWEYGWNAGDVVKKPEFGRTKLISDTFYCRNGVHTLKVPATD